MPKEMIHLGRPQQAGEFQCWVGWQRDMDVQVGIGLPHDTAEGMRPIGLVEALCSDEQSLRRIGEWLATFARNATTEDKGTLVSSDGETEGYWSYDEASLKRNAMALVIAVDMVHEPFNGTVWWHPTRSAINDLIRTLRKARDAAFGKDE